MCVGVSLEVEYGLVLEALCRHKCRDNFLYLEERGISNAGLGAFNLETETHAGAKFHDLEQVVEGEWALANKVSDVLVLLLKLIELHALGGLLHRLVKFGIELLVLESSLI